MKTTLPLAVPSSPKKAHDVRGGAGHPQPGAGSALGFLAELAAAIGAVAAVGPISPPSAVPGQADQRSGTPMAAVETHGSTVAPTPQLTPDAAVLALPHSAAAFPRPATAQAAGPKNGPNEPRNAVPTTRPTATDASLRPIGPLSGRPAAAAAPSPQRTATHQAGRTSAALAAAPDQPAASTPTAAALATDSAAAGIDPLPAAAASTPTTAPTDDGTGQTTAVLRQVFPEITSVATTPGTHRLAITLHPDDLGEVRVTVVVRGDSVRVNVATDPTSGTARTALQHGAPELRQLLESTGANAHVEFREFAATGAGLGSATDGSGHQQQPQGFAQPQSQPQSQAQAQAQPHPQSDGQHHRQSRTHPDPGPPHRPAVTTATDNLPGAQLPTARTATAGLDRLI